MQTKKNNQQHNIIIRARCTGQFIVYLATWTFQSIQNYLYKLSGKRLSGKMIVRETSCTGNNRRVRARSCPGNVLSGKVIVRETSVTHVIAVCLSVCPWNGPSIRLLQSSELRNGSRVYRRLRQIDQRLPSRSPGGTTRAQRRRVDGRAEMGRSHDSHRLARS